MACFKFLIDWLIDWLLQVGQSSDYSRRVRWLLQVYLPGTCRFCVQEKRAEEERLARQEVDADYMAPFVALMGDLDVDHLTMEQAHKLREMCLLDFKQQLLYKAELIHARFEKVNVSHTLYHFQWRIQREHRGHTCSSPNLDQVYLPGLNNEAKNCTGVGWIWLWQLNEVWCYSADGSWDSLLGSRGVSGIPRPRPHPLNAFIQCAPPKTIFQIRQWLLYDSGEH